MSMTGDRFARAAAVGELMRTGREGLESLPEVEAAAASRCVPLACGCQHGGPRASIRWWRFAWSSAVGSRVWLPEHLHQVLA
jgi:hypothetical protein